MKYIYKIIIIIFIFSLIYFYFKSNNIVNEVNEVKQENIIVNEETKQLNQDDIDLIQHNQRVLSQINDYVKLSDTKNYSHENIALGTVNLIDHHDVY